MPKFDGLTPEEQALRTLALANWWARPLILDRANRAIASPGLTEHGAIKRTRIRDMFASALDELDDPSKSTNEVREAALLFVGSSRREPATTRLAAQKQGAKKRSKNGKDMH